MRLRFVLGLQVLIVNYGIANPPHKKFLDLAGQPFVQADPEDFMVSAS